MHIGIYTRKSVYTDTSDSVESQLKMCKEYANSNYQVESISIYTDEGFTGANTHRPGFTQLMRDVSNNKVDILICYKIDRISRNVLDFSSTFNILQEKNIQFVSVKEQIDTSTPLGRAMMYICSVFAQMERETISERIKDNMIELAKSGKWAGGKPPIGYNRDKIIINGKKHTTLVKNENEIPFLNMIFDTFLDGYSLGGLETYFKKKSVKTLNGNYLSGSQIHQIIKNPHYVENTKKIYDYFEKIGCIMAASREDFDGQNGIVAYGRTSGGKKKLHKVNTPDKWIISIGLHKPIISADKWIEAQERFGKNMIDKTRKHEIGILKGIVKCKCGCTMRVQHKVDSIYNKIYDNYFCQKRDRKGKEFCDSKMVRVELLDEKIIDLLKQLSLNKEIVHKYMLQQEPRVSRRNSNDIKKELISAKKKIENLTATLNDIGDSSAAKYIVSEIERIDKLITGLNYELREIEHIQDNISRHKNDIDVIYKEICNYIYNFDSLSYHKKVKWLRGIIKECIWDGENLIVTL